MIEPQDIRTTKELMEDLVALKFRLAFSQIQDEELADMETDSASAQQGDEFSEAARERFYRALDRELRKKSIRQFTKHTLPAVGKIAAAALLVFFLGLTSAVALSSTVRVRVMRLILSIEEKYTEVSLEEDPDRSFTVPGEWLADLYPAYLPEGYELTDVIDLGQGSVAEFTNGDGGSIELIESGEFGSTNVDTEDAEITYLYIPGRGDVQFGVKNDKVSAIWAERSHYYVYIITGEELEEAERIVAGMTPIN